jgi:hypothetical protein
MSTPRRIEANRANAGGSTGPRTAAGKTRASRNARRHRLSISVSCDSVLSTEVEELSRRLVGDLDDAEIVALARAFAEADLGRIQRARLQLMRHLLALQAEGRSPAAHKAIAAAGRQLAALNRYDRRARARRRLTVRAFTDRFIDAVERQGLSALPSATSQPGRETGGIAVGPGKLALSGRTVSGLAKTQE